MKKILVIRFSSIGDIVLTTPVLRCIKRQLNEEVELHFLTKKAFEPVIRENPFIDHLHLLSDEDKLSSFAKELKRENFDFVVDLHKNLRSRYIKFVLACPSGTFNKLNLEKWLLTKFKINRLPNVHIVERYFEAVQPLNVVNDGKGLNYYIPESDQVDITWLPEAFNRKYAVLVVGGAHATKRLPTKRLIELCHRINGPIVLIGGKEDMAVGKEIEEFYDALKDSDMPKELDVSRTVVFNGCGKFSLNQSASLIQQSSVVFTHDTGMMHIAAAFKKNTYSIWGNTVPEFGMYPYKTKFKIMEVQNLDCRPCSKIGYDKCPKGHFKCMNKIDFTFWEPLND